MKTSFFKSMRRIESRIKGWSCIFIILLVTTFHAPYSNISFAETGSQRARDYQSLLNKDKPNSVCKEFSSPFNDSNRKSLELLNQRLIGIYGEYRKSYKPGHLHAGIDLKGAPNEAVYAIGRGQVFLIFREFPHRSVVVKHHLLDGKLLYSVYTHVEEIRVKLDQWVDEHTPLARLFSQDELEQASFGTPNHLHIEIRKSFADRGRASYSSMTMGELNTFCMNPLEFFRDTLSNRLNRFEPKKTFLY